MKSRAAFSLVEMVLALAIFASVAAVLVGILGTSLNVARDTLSDSEMTMLAENIQTRLTLDPEWPGDREKRWFDDSAAEVAEEKDATIGVQFELIKDAAFSSDWFETYRVSVRRLPAGKDTAIWTLQRARLNQGQPVVAR